MDALLLALGAGVAAGKPPQTIAASVPEDGLFDGAFRSAAGHEDEVGTPEDEGGALSLARLDAGAPMIAATAPAWAAVPDGPQSGAEEVPPEPVRTALVAAAGAFAMPEGTVAPRNAAPAPAGEAHAEGPAVVSAPGRDQPSGPRPAMSGKPSLAVPAIDAPAEASPPARTPPFGAPQAWQGPLAGGDGVSTAGTTGADPGEDRRTLAAIPPTPAETDVEQTAARRPPAEAAHTRAAEPPAAGPAGPEPLVAEGGDDARTARSDLARPQAPDPVKTSAPEPARMTGPARTPGPEPAAGRGQPASPGPVSFSAASRPAEAVALAPIVTGGSSGVATGATTAISRDLPADPAPAALAGFPSAHAVAPQATVRHAGTPDPGAGPAPGTAAGFEDAPDRQKDLRFPAAGRAPALPDDAPGPADTRGVPQPAAGPVAAGMALATRPAVVSPAVQTDAGSPDRSLSPTTGTDAAYALQQPAQGGTAPGATAIGGSPVSLAQGAAQAIVATLPSPLRELGTGTLEIALDPPELGRVRLSLVETGGVMVVSILADRPETADLMRRHLDILAQEFARSGLEPPQVRIGAGSAEGGTARGGGERDSRGIQRTEAVQAPPPPPPGAGALRALDLRL